MNQIAIQQRPLFRLAGISSMVAGLLIPLDFILPGGNLSNMRLYADLTDGGSIDDWATYLISSSPREVAPLLSGIAMILILITAVILFDILSKDIWQKYVSIIGYIVGCSLATCVFIYWTGSEHAMLDYSHRQPALGESLLIRIHMQPGVFRIFHLHFVPIVLILMGSGFLSWSLLQSDLLPKWLCQVGLAISKTVGVGGFSHIYAGAKYLLQIAPLHFLWFAALGLSLYIKSIK